MKASTAGILASLSALAIPHLSAGAFCDRAPARTLVDGQICVAAELHSHTFFVTVTINGRGPFCMSVDTGSSATLISPELADAVRPVAFFGDGDLSNGINALGDRTEIKRVLLGSIDVGEARFEGVPAYVSPSLGKFSAVFGRRVDGMLGFSLFADVFVALDFPGRSIVLSKKWPERMPRVRSELFTVEGAGVPLVTVQFQDYPIQVIIDTGSNQNLQLPLETPAGVRWKLKPRPGPLVAAIGETERDWIGRLAGPLMLGRLIQADPEASISRGRPSIGMRMLETFCVVFNESQNRVWLCSDALGAIPSPPDFSIGLSLLSERSGWRVAGIIPGSPAEAANIDAGELVTRIEGRPAQDWTQDEIQKWIDSHDALALVVADPAGERNLSLPVWPLVP